MTLKSEADIGRCLASGSTGQALPARPSALTYLEGDASA